MDDFTIENGIAVQKNDLDFWKSVLKDEVYSELEKWTTENNATATTGYDIRRGDALKYHVLNYGK